MPHDVGPVRRCYPHAYHSSKPFTFFLTLLVVETIGGGNRSTAGEVVGPADADATGGVIGLTAAVSVVVGTGSAVLIGTTLLEGALACAGGSWDLGCVTTNATRPSASTTPALAAIIHFRPDKLDVDFAEPGGNDGIVSWPQPTALCAMFDEPSFGGMT